MSRIRANTITNQNANGAPNFPDGITVSGVITATVSNSTLNTLAVTGNATVGGTLGVGGVLTYEDVTNVDSVGVVTARSGIRIGTGGTVGPVGSGIVTYFGDGSNLTGTGGGLQSMNVFTSTGTSTWNKPSGITKVKVYVTGSGGGCSAVGGNRADDVGAGGAAGGTAIKIIDVSSISSVTVTVGVGGTATPYNAGSSANDTTGGAGQPSSFGSHCSATGGGGGKSYTYLTGAGPVSVGHATPGVGSGGDLNIQGGYGALPILNYNGAPSFLSGGLGGVSFWGGPGRGAADDDFTSGNHDISGGSSSGSTAGAFGSGGSAGSRNFTGGAGTHGVVVVENYQ